MRVVHTFNLAFDESTVVIRLTLLVMVWEQVKAWNGVMWPLEKSFRHCMQKLFMQKVQVRWLQYLAFSIIWLQLGHI